MTCKYAAVLFDLDGTLLDTALDLCATTNYVLQVYHSTSHIDDWIARHVASDGVYALLKAAIPEEEHMFYDFEAMRATFLEYYHEHINDRTIYFGDMQSLLQELKRQQVKIAVVTSKPHHLAVKLLSRFEELANEVIVGGDAVPYTKPDPRPLLYACEQLHVRAEDCIYVGDHIRDIEAAHNAHMPAVLALWGYLRDRFHIDHYHADFVAKCPYELGHILGVEYAGVGC